MSMTIKITVILQTDGWTDGRTDESRERGSDRHARGHVGRWIV